MEAHDPEYANQMEHRIIRRDGQERFVVSRFRVSLDETGRLVRTYGVNQDITERIQAENERKKLEELLRQSQKLEAIGTLAGGIAHDFNNLLSVILGHAELLQLGITDATQTQHSLDQVVSASERARNLVHQILAFSRHAEHPRQLFHLEAVVQETVAFLRASLPTTIQIDSSLQASIPPILGDPTQIQQVLINLSTNAAHAMEAQGGLLRIALERIHLDPGQARHYAGIAPGDYVQLSVTDTGCGIDPAIMDRIFDPYFTTKEFGKGSGLGLSVVHGIVSAHDGAIRIDSEPGKGATFNILLPPAPAQQRDPSQQASTAALPRGNESILLVDDEPTLVDLTQQMLTHLGYRVEAQTNPVRALDLFRTKPEGYDLVITDMTMPELTGLHLAQELLHMRPEQRIMLCTGYSDQIDEPQARAMGIHCFALKPMAIKDLAVAVRTTLDQ
jgi:signal transduction histidine kinase/CheY-like chemotaxis protein